MDIDPIKNILLCSINKLIDIIPRLLGIWHLALFYFLSMERLAIYLTLNAEQDIEI